MRQVAVRTRLPFRYGIVTLTECPHLLCRVTLEVDGRPCQGIAADHLPPKWFTKDPAQTYADEIEQMLLVIRAACGFAEGAGSAASVFELWKRVDDEQSRWGGERKLPPLLSGFGASLVERAMIDAFCRATGRTFAAAVRDGSLGVRLDAMHPELRAVTSADLLPPAPLRSIVARHTVGLLDPLTDDEIVPADRVDDGLPQSLEACIRAYGLTHFKLKLGGDPQADAARLRLIAEVLRRTVAGEPKLTLDGNENFRDLARLQELSERVCADPVVQPLFAQSLLFVEQPMPRDVALSDAAAGAVREWSATLPMIIDESGGTCADVRRALDVGYVGTSHKNCKGVFKGIANACLLEHRRRTTGGRFVLSGEDLSNIGPVALQQDLAVMATLGVPHVERNGHHYFAGLSMWDASVQDRARASHGDLYRRTESGFPSVRIERGAMSVGSVVDAPFGVAEDVPHLL